MEGVVNRRTKTPRLAIWLTALAILAAACSPTGGGGSSPDTGPQDPPAEDTPSSSPSGDSFSDWPALTPEARTAVIADVVDFADAVSWADQATAHAEIADYLKSRAEFVDVGVSDDNIVWARFVDGGLYVYVDNDPREDESAIASADEARSTTQLDQGWAVRAATTKTRTASTSVMPESTTASILEAYGPLDAGAGVAIEPWLEEAGYSVVRRDATADAMLSVAGDGVFLYNGHGGVVGIPFRKDEPNLYVLTSVTPTTAENNLRYSQELESGRMAWASIAWTVNPDYAPSDPACKTADDKKRKPKQCRPRLHKSVYGITDLAIQNWRFARGALVVINACTSKEIENTILDTGNVGAFVGWTASVAIKGAPEVLGLFFDRLLGRNEIPPDEFPELRPFDAGTVFTYMAEKTMIADPMNTIDPKKWTAELSVEDRYGTVLVPSIKSMEVFEGSNELFITGLFGQREGKIVVGGTELDPSKWGPDLVVAKIQDTGSTAAGIVTVEVDGRKSNPVPLTEWRGKIYYTADIDGLAKGLNAQVEFDVHLRADVHMYREVPWIDPVERKIAIKAAGDSKAPWSVSGSGSAGEATMTLSGGGSLEVEENQPDHDGALFSISGTLKTVDPGTAPIVEDLTIHAHFEVESSATLKVEEPGAPSFSGGFPLPQSPILNDLPFKFNNEFGIEVGQVEGQILGIPGPALLYWDDIPSKFPPSLDAPPQA